jgi:threonylcarbamoyladenosine tRNA methylthiotransferase MtaB
MPEPRVVTFGCRLNALESEVIRGRAAAAGLTDAVIVNTCAVTAEAVRQSRQSIRRLRRDHPRAPIIVTGCAAQLAPDAFAAMPEVTRVLGNAEKIDAAAYAPGPEAVMVADIMSMRQAADDPIDGIAGRTRAFAAVQHGCDHRCTFCIVPFARGPARSVPADRVVAQVRRLVDNGYREVVLTGVDVCSYGRDLDGRPGFGALVRRVLREVPALARLRLSSLDPAAVDDDLFRALADEPRLMPHWHLSLQAADDLVLKRMRRRHDRASVAAVVGRARAARPDIVFGADLIAGFPTETEARFERTLAAVGELGLGYLHVFPFSPRPGTPAARMPQVPRAVREARARRLRAAGEAARSRLFAGRIGAVLPVLVERPGLGRSPCFAPVRLAFAAGVGTIVDARITDADDTGLFGERVR